MVKKRPNQKYRLFPNKPMPSNRIKRFWMDASGQFTARGFMVPAITHESQRQTKPIRHRFRIKIRRIG